jgi:hypothetical protein
MRALFSCNIVVESVKAHDGSSWMQTQCVEHSEHDRCEAHRVASTNCRAASRLRTPRITVAPWTDAHDGSSEGRGEEVYGKDVTLLVPKEGFVIKTKEPSTGQRAYINVCTSDKVMGRRGV